MKTVPEALEAAALRVLADFGAPGDVLRSYSAAFNALGKAATTWSCPHCFLASSAGRTLQIVRPRRAGWGSARCFNTGCRAEVEFRE